jgi:hypothetical protein
VSGLWDSRGVVLSSLSPRIPPELGLPYAIKVGGVTIIAIRFRSIRNK